MMRRRQTTASKSGFEVSRQGSRLSRNLCPYKKTILTFLFASVSLHLEGVVVQLVPPDSSSENPDNPRVEQSPPLALFDTNHGQRNWAQTGFNSREMHTNFVG